MDITYWEIMLFFFFKGNITFIISMYLGIKVQVMMVWGKYVFSPYVS